MSTDKTEKIMNFCELIDVPAMPSALKDDLLSYVAELKAQNKAFECSYGTVETEDSSSAAYISNIREYIKLNGMPRPVSFWQLNESLQSRVSDWLTDTQYKDCTWKIQYVRGRSSVAPHKDIGTTRTRNLVYVLQAGGPDVRTTWWELRSDIFVPETTAIPFDKIHQIYSDVLNENCMYIIDVATIHSVSTLRDDRIMLSVDIA
jgi:hypothetical protein